jgi:predicted RNase H-like nuclease (RuvC/YqgF family)
MADIQTTAGIWASIGTAFVSLVAGGMWFVKQRAKDSADIAGSKAEVEMLAELKEENKTLKEERDAANKERIGQWRQIAEMDARLLIIQNSVEILTQQNNSLTAQVDLLTQQNQSLTKEVSRLRTALEANK